MALIKLGVSQNYDFDATIQTIKLTTTEIWEKGVKDYDYKFMGYANI